MTSVTSEHIGIDAVRIRAAQKQAQRLLSSFPHMADDDHERLERFVTLYVAADRAGYDSLLALEASAGVVRNGDIPVTIQPRGIHDVLARIRQSPKDVGGIIAGAHAYAVSMQKNPGRISLGDAVYVRASPTQKTSLIGCNQQLEDVLWSVEQLFYYDVQTQTNVRVDAMHPAVLLYGPPGTGKTSISKAAITHAKEWAEELGVHFSYASFSAADYSKWVGESARTLRSRFSSVADTNGVGVFVIDDVDMIVQSRNDTSASHGGLQVTAELMHQLSGLEREFLGNTLVLASTNRYEALDAALLRRFSHCIEVPSWSKKEDYLLYVAQKLSALPPQQQHTIAHDGYEKRLSPCAVENVCRTVLREAYGRPCIDDFR